MGRFLLLLLLFFCAITASAQHANTGDTPIVVKQLPKEGFVLDRGWKFTAVDNPSFADPAYDDQNWQLVAH